MTEYLNEVRIIHRSHFNEYKIFENNECEFYIINKKKEKFTVKVDYDVLLRLIEFNKSWNVKWSKTSKANYVCCTEYLGIENGKVNQNILYLHRWILNPADNEYVDHINQYETLDNRRNNLRITTMSNNNKHRKTKNSNNKSGYRNVCMIDNKWIVQLQINGRGVCLGKFDDVDEAGKFAEEMRQKYYKEYKGSN